MQKAQQNMWRVLVALDNLATQQVSHVEAYPRPLRPLFHWPSLWGESLFCAWWIIDDIQMGTTNLSWHQQRVILQQSNLALSWAWPLQQEVWQERMDIWWHGWVGEPIMIEIRRRERWLSTDPVLSLSLINECPLTTLMSRSGSYRLSMTLLLESSNFFCQYSYLMQATSEWNKKAARDCKVSDNPTLIDPMNSVTRQPQTMVDQADCIWLLQSHINAHLAFQM